MPYRYLWKRLRDFFIYRVLHVDDTPHRIALGVAIGMFVTWTPTIGFQMILTVLICWLVRANKAVGVPFVWLSNPLTIVPIYYPNYVVGCWFVGGDFADFDFIEAMTRELPAGWWAKIIAWWSNMGQALWRVFVPLWVGSIIVGLIIGVMTYPLVYWAVVAYRRHRHRHDAPPPAAPADEAHPAPPAEAQGPEDT
jgi:uncharacterized protein (DUF2062 family)